LHGFVSSGANISVGVSIHRLY